MNQARWFSACEALEFSLPLLLSHQLFQQPFALKLATEAVDIHVCIAMFHLPLNKDNTGCASLVASQKRHRSDTKGTGFSLKRAVR